MFTKFNYFNQLVSVAAILIFTARFSSSCLVGCLCEQTKITCENVDVFIGDLKELRVSSEIIEFYLRGNNLN